ncbi:MAG: ActS/PrrB/RegB family redox-sensitive histidine kinase [Pseudorhodobacter sp.]|nr:ActS/PrrB/RegB family redox-sensitive histidine kinase [Pseudorhodobacter sp.]
MFRIKVQQTTDGLNGDLVPLRTLTNLRWMAIAGQIGALTIAPLYFSIDLPWGLCAAAVGSSVIANLIFTTVYPTNKRLSEREALAMLLFDLGQLALLLTAAGGLTNPFALLVLAPVTISATALSLRSTVLVAVSAIALVALTDYYGMPLQRSDGVILEVPPLLRLGYLLSIVIGIVFLSLYSRRVATEIRTMSNALFAAHMALAREQKLTDLGGVVAATAHELGTPLATIKLVSTEMIDDLQGQDSLLQDAMLIRQQADRCRDILRSMGQAGKDDLHLKQAPLFAVVHEAAQPHLLRGKTVLFGTENQDPGQPNIQRRPEVIHGLRNLVQNAVDFAAGKVWIDTTWTAQDITVRISDDGAGFPPQVIGRIGDPFMRLRPPSWNEALRKEYEGMGLGLFIAKTLLERTGAEMTFANAADPFLSPKERPERCGAVVVVRWPRLMIEAPSNLAIAENRLNIL